MFCPVSKARSATAAVLCSWLSFNSKPHKLSVFPGSGRQLTGARSEKDTRGAMEGHRMEREN
ncbi:UNVERIFIED_CONTAM: hypothetical protein ABIE34_000721 [Jeotgalibacillus campisalis]